MKLWNSDEELEALVDAAAREVEAEERAERKLNITILNNNKGNKEREKWQALIDEVKARSDQELARKRELFRKTGNIGLFTPEDIDAMIYENENFKGKNVDFSQVKKYNQLADSARWLDANSNDIVKVECPPLPTSRSEYIYVDIKAISHFNDDEVQRTLAGMIMLCDGVTFIGMDGDAIHLKFLVRDIRTN